jgi:hypothetical protein
MMAAAQRIGLHGPRCGAEDNHHRVAGARIAAAGTRGFSQSPAEQSAQSLFIADLTPARPGIEPPCLLLRIRFAFFSSHISGVGKWNSDAEFSC